MKTLSFVMGELWLSCDCLGKKRSGSLYVATFVCTLSPAFDQLRKQVFISLLYVKHCAFQPEVQLIVAEFIIHHG